MSVMLRVFWFLAVLAAVVALAVWLAGNPGHISADWRGHRIETSVAFLFVVMAAIAGGTALLYRIWLFLRRSPKTLKDVWRQRRRRQGYEALTRGMVAVAAGDAQEAGRHARRAETLLEEPPLTMLLSAQTAQLKGDDKAATEFFKAMADDPETAFLGVRGLLTQAMKKGNEAEALKLARRAYRLRPKSEWVSATLFDLQIAADQWQDALVTSDEQVRNRLLPMGEGKRRKALLAFEQSQVARTSGDAASELDYLKRACDQAPDLVPALVRIADRFTASGRRKKAAILLEKAWAASPHPDFVGPYLASQQAVDPLARVRAAEKLAAKHAGHPESCLALAEYAIGAKLWGEARRHLEAAGSSADTPDWDGCRGRAYRLLAALEEGEGTDPALAREWLKKASLAESDRAWVCGNCGNTTSAWTAVCGNCGTFDSFAWRTPPHVTRLTGEDRAELIAPELRRPVRTEVRTEPPKLAIAATNEDQRPALADDPQISPAASETKAEADGGKMAEEVVPEQTPAVPSDEQRAEELAKRAAAAGG